MNPHTDITKEWETLKTSFARHTDGQIYPLPQGFFEQFPASMLAIAQAEHLTRTLSKDIPFYLPNGYFDTFPSELKKKLFQIPASEETEALSPLLAQLKDKPTFQLPADDYFDQKPAAPQTLSINPDYYRAESRIRRMHWVAAAAILCIFFIGGLSLHNGTATSDIPNTSPQAALAGISDADIQAYLDSNTDIYDLYSTRSNTAPYTEMQLLDKLSDQEVRALLETQAY